MTRQHAYFVIKSTSLTTSDMSEAIGLAPDEARVRGDLHADPPVPLEHSWIVHAPDRSAALDEQIKALRSRLTPYRRTIAQLVAVISVKDDNPGNVSSLRVARHVEDDDRCHTDGWRLDVDTLRFLTGLDASIQIVEFVP